MKRTIFIYLSLILACHIGVCQNRMLQNLGYVKTETTLPYKYCEDKFSPEQPVFGFPIDNFIGTSFKNCVWTDLTLTQEETMKTDSDSDNIWPTCNIDHKFKTDNQNFILFSVLYGAYDYGKYSLITIDQNGKYTDSIAVGAIIYEHGGDCFPMKWEITEDLTVKTYQLKPTSSTPILYDSDIPDTVHAERIDRTYKIDSNGKFSEVETKFYKPQNYPKEKFLDKSYDISTGNEIYIKPIK